MASNLIRPWHLGQLRRSTAKVRAKKLRPGAVGEGAWLRLLVKSRVPFTDSLTWPSVTAVSREADRIGAQDLRPAITDGASDEESLVAQQPRLVEAGRGELQA